VFRLPFWKMMKGFGHLKRYDFSSLKLWEIDYGLSASRRTSLVQERITDFNDEWDGWVT
jgi:hypothetical protein